VHATVLTDAQISRIHTTSLDILERVGVHLPHPEALALFLEAGANVDMATQRVRIPHELVTQSVGSAGKQFSIFGRDLSRRADFGCGKRNYNSIAGEAMWVDEAGGERRYATLADVATASRFADALQGINIVGAMADPHEVPVAHRCVEIVATMLRNTTKPIHFWFHDRASARYVIEMMIALRGGETAARETPVCYPFLEPISPLRFAFNGVDILFETSRLNLPVPIGPMAQMGLSAPGTLAGTMAQENAEILAGVCITQLIQKGMPVCYGGICHAFDMSTTQMIFSGPEQAIFGVAMTQLGKFYGLPVYINVGLTDSKRPDAQAGLEIGTTLALGAAAGADIFGHMGISGVDQASSLDMLVLQDEAIGYVDSVMRSPDFDDEALGFDEIMDAGPGGTYIDRIHTAKHFRRELWFPRLLDREYYQAWLDRGAKTTEESVRERKQDILATHSPSPLPVELDRALSEIVGSARRNLG
jgi:trimethylamine---corrinoid protein Co-methyltransferase